MSVEKGGLLATVVLVRLSAWPRADDALDEVTHGEEQQEDEDAGQFAREPTHVVEEGMDGQFATAHSAGVPRGYGGTALLSGATLDLTAAPQRFTRRYQTSIHQGASCPARHTGHGRKISDDPKRAG